MTCPASENRQRLCSRCPFADVCSVQTEMFGHYEMDRSDELDDLVDRECMRKKRETIVKISRL